MNFILPEILKKALICAIANFWHMKTIFQNNLNILLKYAEKLMLLIAALLFFVLEYSERLNNQIEREWNKNYLLFFLNYLFWAQ